MAITIQYTYRILLHHTLSWSSALRGLCHKDIAFGLFKLNTTWKGNVDMQMLLQEKKRLPIVLKAVNSVLRVGNVMYWIVVTEMQ